MKQLLGTHIAVSEDNSDEPKQLPSGLFIPPSAKLNNPDMKSGVVTHKGTGTPWNRMENVHVKQRVMYRKGAGVPFEEERDGIVAKYRILEYNELWFEE